MHLMNLLTTILLIADILCLVAAVVVLVVYLIIALVKKIRKEPAKTYVIKGLLNSVYCLMACVVITWLLKMGFSVIAKMHSL